MDIKKGGASAENTLLRGEHWSDRPGFECNKGGEVVKNEIQPDHISRKGLKTMGEPEGFV